MYVHVFVNVIARINIIIIIIKSYLTETGEQLKIL